MKCQLHDRHMDFCDEAQKDWRLANYSIDRDKNFTKVSVSEIDDLILMTYLPYILSRES